MSKLFVAGICLLGALTACVTGPHSHRNNVSNAALAGTCLATSLPPCEVATPDDVKAQKKEAKAAATRTEAQQSANAATKDAVARSSCLTDTGPRLPLSPGQCAAYGRSYSGKDIQSTGQQNAGAALQMLDPSITVQH
jgi:hypothetical protein